MVKKESSNVFFSLASLKKKDNQTFLSDINSYISMRSKTKHKTILYILFKKIVQKFENVENCIKNCVIS